jgi:hypothetical protein
VAAHPGHFTFLPRQVSSRTVSEHLHHGQLSVVMVGAVGWLGPAVNVAAHFGHLRDLPRQVSGTFIDLLQDGQVIITDMSETPIVSHRQHGALLFRLALRHPCLLASRCGLAPRHRMSIGNSHRGGTARARADTGQPSSRKLLERRREALKGGGKKRERQPRPLSQRPPRRRSEQHLAALPYGSGQALPLI